MSNREKIFHDSWYRIADQRITLRPSVRIHRQVFRGEIWYILHDPYANQFYRFPSEVYEFIARLSPRRTVDEIWNALINSQPETAPTQGNLIDLLAQLYQGNLIHSDLPPDSIRLFERYKKRETKKKNMQMLNLLFARIPLYDPDRLLKSLLPIIRLLFSPVGIILWVLAVGIGVMAFIDNFAVAIQQTQGILAPSNLFLLYIAIASVKLFHEFGHSMAVRRFGGEVHTMGVMFLMLTPLPYMDATAAWAFRNRWKRLLVGASGMVFELFIAAIAIIIWANTGEGVLHALAYNMAIAGSVSSIIFNINPLLRYDGYYMLSDLTDTPNLQQQSKKETTYLIEKYLFGKKDCVAVGATRKESFLMVLYNLASTGYRFLIFGSLLLIVSKKLLLLAVFMGIYLVISWMVVPLVKGVKYLFTDPSLHSVRGRALQITGAAIVGACLFVTLIPFPLWFKAPGVLKAEEFQNVTNQTAGVVKIVCVNSGDQVHRGDTLYVMANKELLLKQQGARAAITEVESQYRKALHTSRVELLPLENRRRVLHEKLDHIDSQLIQLVVKSPLAGFWYSPSSIHVLNRWIPKGTFVGQLINRDKFFFAIAVSQKDIGQLFSRAVTGTEIRLKGQAGTSMLIDTMIIIPMEQNRLPSSALGYMRGGEIAVKSTDSSGTVVAEPFYEVRVGVVEKNGVVLWHGHSGFIKISLGHQPLLWQWMRRLRQLIQKNYKV